MDMIEPDDPTLIHMLGYLTTEQWMDALALEDLDKEAIWKLIDRMDERYGGMRKEIELREKEEVVDRLVGSRK